MISVTDIREAEPRLQKKKRFKKTPPVSKLRMWVPARLFPSDYSDNLCFKVSGDGFSKNKLYS